MKYKTVVKDFGPAVKQWRKSSLGLIRSLKNHEVFLNLENTSTSLTECECIRAVSQIFPESIERNLLLNCMLDAEKASAGGAYAMLLHFTGLIKDDEIAGKRFKIDDLKQSLERLVGQNASELVMDATKITGRSGKIFLDSLGSQVSEISFGTQVCKWSPPENFFASVKMPKISVQNCRVAFIDGIIESVAESHRIFQWSYDQKTPVVIFARGFAEEVIATAGVNFQRRTAQVIPIVIAFDEVGVNSFGDIASCFGSDAISADKGQLVSSIDLENCVKVERITVLQGVTEIEFSDSRVDSVIERLSKKLLECDVNQSELIKKRIEAIGTGSVTIKIGSEKKNLSGIQRDRVDFGIRFIKSCLAQGVVKIDGISFPAMSLKNGIKCSKSFSDVLAKSGASLEVDRCG